MSDYISRRKALEYIELCPWDTKKDYNRAIHHIRELVPSEWKLCNEGLPDEYDSIFLVSSMELSDGIRACLGSVQTR